MKFLNNNSGFTLLEAMIVVVLIGILGAIAVPVYKNYAINARCAEARNLLGAAATLAEETAALNGGSYGSFVLPTGTSSIDLKAKYFTISAPTVVANGVTLRAEGKVGAAGSITSTDYITLALSDSGRSTWAAGGGCDVPTD